METYRCYCGKTTIQRDWPPALCVKCEDCGSTLAKHPSLCTSALPHNWRHVYDPFSNRTFIGCHDCGTKKSEVK